ncbi:MAG: ATP-binding cassette domain-containing protein [Dehalococcoidales bacterium]
MCPQTAKTGTEKPALIEYRNITVSQNNHLMLDGINLIINQGEHVAILGPNGAGKSSFIKTITREYYPHAGVPDAYMRILGKEYWNVFELRTRLGIVSNDLVNVCTGNYSGRRVMLSGFFSSIGIWPHHKVTPAMEQKVDEVMALLEIQHLADRPTNQISSGEARRILIGRALVHDPETLVLDEPSSSLDLHATYELRKILRKIAVEGTSIVMVTHQLADIIPEITRIITIKAGRIFEDGLKEEVLTSASLSRLFGSTFEVLERDGYYYLW